MNEAVEFTSSRCGLGYENAECACPRRLPEAIKLGRVQRDIQLYAIDDALEYIEVLEKTRKLEANLRTLKLQQTIPAFRSPRDFGAMIEELVS